MSTKIAKIYNTFKNIFGQQNYPNPTPLPPAETSTKTTRYLPLDKLIYEPESRQKEDIQSWRNALLSAEDVYRPRRDELYRLYREIILDNHLQSALNIRRQRIHAMPPVIYDKNSVSQPQFSALFNSGWFENFVYNCMDTLFWGHTLLEIKIQNQNVQINLIPRDNVRPECGEFVINIHDEKGIPYRISQFANSLIEIGGTHTLGLLNNAGPIVLFKRNTLICWSEFCEVFGQPIVIAKTTSQDAERKGKIMEQLKKLARSARAVFEPNEEIAILESKRGDDPKIFSVLVETCNKELSKLIVGQTMVLDDGSSKSQAQVHDLLFDDITLSDKRYVERIANEQLIPKLIAANILSEGSILELEKDITLTPTAHASVIAQLSPYYIIPDEYIKENFGMDVKARPDRPLPTNSTNKNITQTNSKK